MTDEIGDAVHMLESKSIITGKKKASRWVKPVVFACAGLFAFGIAAPQITSFKMSEAVAENALTRVQFSRAPLSFADLAEKIKPSVVSINVKKKGRKRGKNKPGFKGLPDLPFDHPLNEFFRRFGQGPKGGNPGGRGRALPSLAQGSGFIISEDGYVVTNNHVVDSAGGEGEITVTLDNGDKLEAKLIGGDARTDIALLKIQEKRKFPKVKFATKQARVGDWVLAVGNPFGLGGTVTAGIVSAKNRDIGSGPYDYLQIDAAVNRGNSGGPAFNLDGEVIGVNTAIYSPSGGNVGIAFAVPAALTQEVVAQLKSSGSVSRGWLGVTIQDITDDDLAESMGLKKTQGALVTEIFKGSPAAKAKIRIGDTIVKVNEGEVKDSRDLARKIAALPPKGTTNITVSRDGEEKVLSVKLGQFPGSKKLARLRSGEELGEELNDLGLTLAPASSKPGAGDQGVIITDIDPESTAAEKGLKRGDIILQVGRKKVNSSDDVFDSIEDAQKAGKSIITLRIKSGNRARFIGLPLKKS